MCGRFYLDAQQEALADYFDLEQAPELTPRYNIAPSQAVLAVVQAGAGREIRSLHWGLIPFWAKDRKIGYRTINARAETVESKPAYRAAFKHRRCLIPASGFYEWKALASCKQPYCIRPKRAPLFALAGLYEHWQGQGGETVDSCSIIVTGANPAMRTIHERMPVILKPTDFARWLDPQNQQPAALKSLLLPWPDDDLEIYPVSKRVGNPGNDDPECIVPVS
ncbi:MAG: SOS response-associated peptidase [Candidatus Thiodiazotropha sp.]